MENYFKLISYLCLINTTSKLRHKEEILYLHLQCRMKLLLATNHR